MLSTDHLLLEWRAVAEGQPLDWVGAGVSGGAIKATQVWVPLLSSLSFSLIKCGHLLSSVATSLVKCGCLSCQVWLSLLSSVGASLVRCGLVKVLRHTCGSFVWRHGGVLVQMPKVLGRSGTQVLVSQARVGECTSVDGLSRGMAAHMKGLGIFGHRTWHTRCAWGLRFGQGGQQE